MKPMRQAWLQEADDEGDEGEDDEDEDDGEEDDGEGHAEENEEEGKEGDSAKKANLTSSKQKVQIPCHQHMRSFVCYPLPHVNPDNWRS